MMSSIPVKSKNRQQGISLIELMIAITIGLLLVGGLMDVLTNSTVSYRVQDAMMRMQENGQFGMEFMTKDIRSTDFWGCLTSLDDITNLLDPAGPSYDVFFDGFQSSIEGTENAGGGGPEVAGTDTLTIRASREVAGGRTLLPPYGPTTADPIRVGSGSNIQTGDIVVVSDCLQGNIFQVTNINGAGDISHAMGVGSPGNISPDLSKVYAASAFIYTTYTHTYSIRTGANGLPALFLSDENGDQELVEAVESMIVLFGEDTDGDGDANRYVRANSVADMDNVVSLRIQLLLQSLEDNLTTSPQPYVFNGATVTPTDNRLRRVYTQTIVLRNRSG